jgi:hypothetical protein
MNILVPLIIVALLVVFIGFKWNNLRTKLAYFFILFGVLFVLFFLFLVVTGSSFNFSSIGETITSLRVYFVWMRDAAVNVFETTGRVIGLSKGNSTG